MRPYKITLDESNGFWIDLDSVQAIHDPFVPSRNHILKDAPSVAAMYPAFSLAIVLAFRDTPKIIESRDPDKVEHLINEHAKFVQAWKAQ